MFSKIWLEKHGDVALQDSWAFAELDNFVLPNQILDAI